MAITTAERDQIIKLVVGMFNAAPGSTYLNLIVSIYEANGHNLPALAQTLAGTTAFQQIHPNFETAGEFATSFLTQFGLQGNQTAIDFITSRFNAGVSKGVIIQQAISVLDGIDPSVGGTIGAAAAILDNKGAVATYYSVTRAVPQTDLATLQNVIAAVDSTAASVTSAQANIDAGAQGVSLPLTQNQDSLLGGSTNDTFTANIFLSGTTAINTLQSFDSINGAGGTDALVVTLTGGTTVAPTLTSIENVTLRTTTAGDTLDLVNSTGVATVTVGNSTAASAVATTGATANLAVANQNVGVTFSGSTAATLGLRVDTVGVDQAIGSQVAVALPAAAATTLNVTANAANVNVTGAAAVTAATIAATGANRVNLSGSAATLGTLTVSGTGSVNLSDSALVKVSSLTVGDGGVTFTNAGSTATSFAATTGAGKDTLTITGGNTGAVSTGAGNDSVSVGTSALAAGANIDLGAGDDTLTIGGALTVTAGATLNGGDGKDTLAMDTAAYTAASAFTAANLAKITNFEVLSITDVLAGGATVDLSKIAGLTSFQTVGVAAAGTATVTNVGANADIILKGALAANTGTLVVSLKDATGTADVVNLTTNTTIAQNNDGTVDTTAATITSSIAGVETINWNSTGTLSATLAAGAKTDVASNTLALTDTALKTLTITGDQAAVYTVGAAQTALTAVNASANTGGSTISAAAVGTVALTITGSATAANTLTGSGKADTIVGGAKADTITGGAGGDSITVGAGNDTVAYTNVSDSTLVNLDVISDFSANTYGNGASGAAGTGAGAVASRTGDVIKLDLTAMVAAAFTTTTTGWSVAAATTDGVVTSVQTNSADATTFLANLAASSDTTLDFAVGAALDSSTGKLYIDLDSSGTADMVIQLTGATTITAAAFVLA